jgi:Ca-activated chloride channel family protein
MTEFEFSRPFFLLLLVPWLYMIYLYFFRDKVKQGASISVSSREIVPHGKGFKSATYPYMAHLRFIILFFLIVSLAGPGRGVSFTSIKSRGIDIVIALDLSLSMSAEDLEPDRLTVSKKVLKDFISRRESDRIGLVVFAGEAYLQCPVTLEHNIVNEIVDDLDFETVDEEGTAVGNAIALSVSRLMDSTAKSRVVLLITDGVSNRGFIDPETAGKAASEMGVKVYTIGVGRDGEVSFTSPDGRRGRLFNHFDETSLRNVAEITGGKFYRADDAEALAGSIKDIDALEKSEIENKKYYQFHDKSLPFILLAVSLLFLEIMLKSLYYRKIP